MLDEIALTDTILFHIREQLLHTVQLMVSWPDLFHGFLLRVRIFINDNLSVILNNSGEFPLRQNVLPQIVCHDAVRVRRIARTIVIALVEWQKPAVFTSKLRAEHDGLVVYREMHHAPFKREQRVPRIAIFLILLNGICCRLTGEMILELNRDGRKTVDEQAKVEREFRSVNRIAKLSCHTEDILLKHLL